MVEHAGWRRISLGVTITRLDDLRKVNYNASVARYEASKGALMAIDDVTGDRVRLINQEGARRLRAAAMMVKDIPTAKIDCPGLDFFVLQPGERAVVPVKWEGSHAGTALPQQDSAVAALCCCCSTHPEAPVGLAVLPGEYDAKSLHDRMSIVVENESPLPVTVTDQDAIAAGTEEGSLPTLEACAMIQSQQEEFQNALDWSGAGADSERVVPSPVRSREVVVVVHRVSLFPLVHRRS